MRVLQTSPPKADGFETTRTNRGMRKSNCLGTETRTRIALCTCIVLGTYINFGVVGFQVCFVQRREEALEAL